MTAKDPRYYQQIKDHLARHGIVSSSESITDDNWSDMIMAFQDKAKVLVDGDVGPVTLWALQYPFVKEDKKLRMVKVACDRPKRHNDGFGDMMLREDAATAFERLAARIREKGGQVTSSGGQRSLAEKPNQHQSATSFHYTGLAFDLAVATGSWAPETDPFVMEYAEGESRPWTVWARAEGGEERTLKAVGHRSVATGRDKWAAVDRNFSEITGRFVNFTQIAADEGFQPIGPRRGYKSKTPKQYMSAEWWHFQYEAALTPAFSQFGIELLRVEGYLSFWRVFEQGQMNPRNVWENARLVFMEGWR